VPIIKNNNHSIQFFIYLLAYSAAQRPIIKYAQVKRETEHTHTHKQGNLYHLHNETSINAITPYAMHSYQIIINILKIKEVPS
jgi:hypothetical protein